ncbi:MAG: sigma-70 family RNA polymerase sigma factor [Planctomycetota bacterium]
MRTTIEFAGKSSFADCEKMAEITQVLNSISNGDRSATHSLVGLIYEELRGIAKFKFLSESSDHTLQPTALVNEAFLRLLGPNSQADAWENRAHFYCAAAEAMRRILVDHARRRGSIKRGGTFKRVQSNEELPAAADKEQEVIEINEVLELFAEEHPDKAQLVKLRYFAGMTIPEVAEILKISTATANRSWAFSRAWLFDRIHGPTAGGAP